jgi:hypothetical protein
LLADEPVRGTIDPQQTAHFAFDIVTPKNVGRYGLDLGLYRGETFVGGCTTSVIGVGDVDSSVCQHLHEEHVRAAAEADGIDRRINGLDWKKGEARDEAASLRREYHEVAARIKNIEREQVNNGCAPN